MNDDPTKDDADGLVLDWADAVENWEIDLDGRAKAEASPLSTRPLPGESTRPPPPPSPLAPTVRGLPAVQLPESDHALRDDALDDVPTSVDEARPRPRLYRPPSDDEVAALEARRRAMQASRPTTRPVDRGLLPSSRPPLPSGRAPSFAPSAPTATYPTPLVPSEGAPALEIMLESTDLDLDEFEDTVQSERPERLEKKARIARLEALAGSVIGAQASELLEAAAELAEELAELGWAEQLYERARAKAPARLEPIEALARLAFRAGDVGRHAMWLERIVALPIGDLPKARTLAALARLRLVVRGDAAGALAAATEARRIAPDELSAQLLLVRTEAATDPTDLDATLTPLTQRTQDLALAAMWLVMAGRALEARGEKEAARALYQRAAHVDPYAFDAQLSLARVEHALGDHVPAAHALLRTLESFDIGPVAEAVRRRAAHMLGREGEHDEAVALLEHASDDVSLRTAMQVALASGDGGLMEKAAESWTLGTSGAERALALLARAELLAAQGATSRAEQALELAASEDPGQRLVQLARERLARVADDPRRLAELTAGEESGDGALAAAAKLALSSGDGAEELTWLLEASEEESGLTAQVLATDASAELGRHQDLRALLLAQGARGPLAMRVRALLALGELERTLNQPEQARAALRRAVELAPMGAVALRAYARAQPEPGELARTYAEEAENKSGARAAFLLLRSGFAHDPADPGTARLEAFASALRAEPSYAPASWALQREARRRGDLARLSDLHAQEATRASDDRERVAHLVRAALIRASDDSEGAAGQLAHALGLTPDDPVLTELVLRLGDASPVRVRVAALERMAARLAPPFRRPVQLATAGVLEDAGRLDEAEALYQRVLADAPADPLAALGLERVLTARTEPATLLADKQRAARETTTERARARLLEELLLLEPTGPRTLEWARELSALEPAHALANRIVERDAMQRDDRAELLALGERAHQQSTGTRDRAARLRLLAVLQGLRPDAEATQEPLDERLLAHPEDAEQSLWLARQMLSVAVARNDRELVVRAVAQLAAQSDDALEIVALTVQRGWLTLETAAGELAALPAESTPEHPTYLELVAEARRIAGKPDAAAEQFERAAKVAQGRERGAHLWSRAAELWERAGDGERARAALQQAAELDVAHPGVRDRLLGLLHAQRDVDGLIAFTRASITQGGSPEQLAELYRQLARLLSERGDQRAAASALREGLGHAPEHLPSWRDLAAQLARAEEHEGRVEALTAIGRLSRDPLELRDVHLELARLHETDVPDAARAAAAYQRVLKLGPRNTQALEGLAALYRREGKQALAIETLTQLSLVATEPAQRRKVALQLAAWKEEHGDARGAEELLEQLRREAPTDHVLLRGLADLLRRTDATSALAMHLNRSVSDLRQALGQKLDEAAQFATLADMLREKGRGDAAAQVLATGRALELDVPEPPARATEGLGEPALSELFDDLVFPAESSPSLRILFRHGAEALNRAAPLDLRSLGAERIDKRHPLRAVVAELSRWVGARDLDVYTTSSLPYAFVPVSDAPPQLLVGRALLDALTPDEQRFLVVRAFKIARASMSIACRIRPHEMELLLHALVHSQVASYAPAFIEPSTLDEAARRLAKHLGRRGQVELAPHALELTYAGVPSFDANAVYGAASAAGSRAALLALGKVGPALSALVKLSGERTDGRFVEAVMQVDEARELSVFAIGEPHVEARTRAGVEPRASLRPPAGARAEITREHGIVPGPEKEAR